MCVFPYVSQFFPALLNCSLILSSRLRPSFSNSKNVSNKIHSYFCHFLITSFYQYYNQLGISFPCTSKGNHASTFTGRIFCKIEKYWKINSKYIDWLIKINILLQNCAFPKSNFLTFLVCIQKKQIIEAPLRPNNKCNNLCARIFHWRSFPA